MLQELYNTTIIIQENELWKIIKYTRENQWTVGFASALDLNSLKLKEI